MRFKLESNLSPTKYPCLTTIEEILEWLTFAPSVDLYDIDPVVLGRIAAMAKSEGVKHYIISGQRSTKRQAEIYLSKGGVKNPDGTYSDPYKKINGKVAKPNTSDHEIHFAVDSGSKYYKDIETVEHPLKQPKFNKFGLCKPLTKGNGMKKCIENWHLIPLEILKMPRVEKVKLMAKPISKTPIELLVDKKIILSSDYWTYPRGVYDGKYCKQLLVNFYKYVSKKTQFEFSEAIGYLETKMVISDKDYWLTNCQNGKTVKSEHMKVVINRISKLL